MARVPEECFHTLFVIFFAFTQRFAICLRNVVVCILKHNQL
jgi:hypothetical protein